MKEDKFLPTQLIQITNFLSDFIKSKPLVQNIGYTFQYCQYLKHLIKETEVTAVILKQLYKSYIISGVAILEAIFYAILEQEGKIKTFQWKEENNPSIISIDERTKLKINILRKIETSSPKGLKFIAILNQIKKLDFFGQSEQFFKDISDLQRLRNKIHIHTINDWELSDYRQFGEEDFQKMENVLKQTISFLQKGYKRTK